MTLTDALANGFSVMLPSFVEQCETVTAMRLDPDLVITSVNPAMARLVGLEPGDLVGLRCTEVLTEIDGRRLTEAASAGETRRIMLNFVDSSHAPQTVQCHLGFVEGDIMMVGERPLESEDSLQRELLELNNTLAVLSRENSRKSRQLRRANEKLEETLDELNRSFWHLRKIQEVLPICVECGVVKTSEATWEPVVDYLRKHSLFLSHGYCPDCMAKVREEWKNDGKEAHEP
jgi:hypothetical protein